MWINIWNIVFLQIYSNEVSKLKTRKKSANGLKNKTKIKIKFIFLTQLADILCSLMHKLNFHNFKKNDLSFLDLHSIHLLTFLFYLFLFYLLYN